jgi:hypothetical protein
MTEEFLYYIWQYRLYKPALMLTSGEAFQVVRPGDRNSDSGPDFFNARIRIGDTLWAGNVELHINSSDWFRHNHQFDKSYDSIILHVVYNHDREIPRADGTNLPTLEFANHIDQDAWKRYVQFMEARSWIPCESLIPNVQTICWSVWLTRLLVERLERKAARVEQALTASSNDWNQAFYRLLARNMGFKLNNEAFEMLASSLSYRHLAKHADNLFQLEAMVFGQAGLLNGPFQDSYPTKLQKEYDFLRKKFSLTSIDAHIWRFMRLHPGNFPTLRLSQFATIIHKSNGMLMELLENCDLKTIGSLFNSEASEYWKTHYRFDCPVKGKSRRLGSIAIHLLLINLVAPFLFVYGKRSGNSSLSERSIDLLEKLDGENNFIIRRWKSLGIDVSTASHTQALLELKSHYCDQKKCLSCMIGLSLLKEAEASSISKPKPLNQF